MKKMGEDKGVTLIALIVTIVVLIILAVISVNLLMNGNIIGRAEQSKKIQEESKELERLELVKGDVAIDNKGKVTVDKYIEEAIKQGITDEDKVEDNGDGSKNFITDTGWSVNITPDPDNENNVIITIEGKENELPPKIIKLDLKRDETETQLIINVEAKRATTYKYYYKIIGGGYKLAHEGTETSYTITSGISKDKLYMVKVEAINQNDIKDKEISEKDETPPTATITLNKRGVKVGTYGTATVEQTDNGSGVDIAKCKWVLNTSQTKIGTEEESYTGTFSSTKQNIIFKSDTEGEHYLHVLTVDRAENKTETVSKFVRIGKLASTITNTSHNGTIKTIDENGNCVTIPEGFKWMSGKTVQDGIIVQDASGNQFVWIPVSNISGDGSNQIIKNDGNEIEIILGRYENFTDTDGKYIPKQLGKNYSQSIFIKDGSISYKEENVNGRDASDSRLANEAFQATALNLSNFVKSVEKYKGYYMARFEASIASGSKFGVGEDPDFYKISSKVSKTCDETSSGTWKVGSLVRGVTQGEAAYLGRNMYYGNTYVTSDLPNSYMWDTTLLCRYVLSWSLDTNPSSIHNTGTGNYVELPIYDITGNLQEFTTEYSNDSYTVSGSPSLKSPATKRGKYASTGSLGSMNRTAYPQNTSNGNIGLRAGLYIK